jgi:hypothetical protein
VAAFIVFQGLPNGLPGYRPVIAAFFIAQIYIMAGPVKGYTVWPKPRYTVILGGFVK